MTLMGIKATAEKPDDFKPQLRRALAAAGEIAYSDH